MPDLVEVASAVLLTCKWPLGPVHMAAVVWRDGCATASLAERLIGMFVTQHGPVDGCFVTSVVVVLLPHAGPEGTTPEYTAAALSKWLTVT